MKDHFYGKKGFNILEADVSNYQQLLNVTGGEIDIAFYFILYTQWKALLKVGGNLHKKIELQQKILQGLLQKIVLR
jgi:hypothetical protein